MKIPMLSKVELSLFRVRMVSQFIEIILVAVSLVLLIVLFQGVSDGFVGMFFGARQLKPSEVSTDCLHFFQANKAYA